MSDGESTNVGSIVGYLSLNRDQWNRDIRATEDDARKLGALSPTIRVQTNAPTVITQLAGIRAASEEVGRQSPDIRVSSNAAAQTAQMHLLLDSILLLGAAAVPLAGVLGGAAVGLVPVLASVALGIKGISDAEKSGALQHSQYGADIQMLTGWYAQLKTTAASGILNGADQAIKSSRPLFGLLTSDIRTTSNQIGEIVAHTAPALLTIFTQLNPLFVTFGNLVARGGVELEHWAQSSHGVQGFVAYVQANLPSVMSFLGNLITLVSHIAQASAGFGGGILTGLTLLERGINALPIGVLQTLIQLIIAARVAMLANTGVTVVVNAITGAYTKLTATQSEQSTAAAANTRFNQQAAAALSEQAAAAQWAARANQLAALQIQAASLEEAATVARAKALEAEAWAALVLAADSASASVMIASQNEALAAQSAATAAVAAAEETAAAAATMATEIDTAGAVASAGWKAALGPAAGLIAIVGVMSLALLGNSDSAKKAAEAANSYAQSVQSSTDALSAANVAQTNKNLADKGALTQLSDLSASNKTLGVSNIDLALAVNGTQEQYDSLLAKLKEIPGVQTLNRNSSRDQQEATLKDSDSKQKLITTITTLRSGLQSQILTQTQLNQLNAASVGITDSQAIAGAALFGLVGDKGVAAYLAMQQAQQKSTEQADKQTLAWQNENDALDLLQQALDKASGKTISYAQADNAFQQQLISQAKNLKNNKKGLDGLGESAIQNRGDLLSLITAAESTSTAYGNMTGSTEKGRQKLLELRKQIIDNAVAHGEDRKAVTAYIDSILKIPAKVPPTKLDIEDAAAAAKLKAIQDAINALHGKQVDIQVNLTGQGAKNASAIADAKGGFASGGSVGDGWFTVGEQGYELGYKRGSQVQIYSNAQSKKLTGKDRVPGYASGTGDIVTLDSVKSKSHATKSGHGVTSQQEATFANAAASLLIVAATLSDSYSQLRSSAIALDSAARSAHVSESTLKSISSDQAKLLADASVRDKLRAQLGTAPTSGTTAYDRLSAAQRASASLRSSVSGSITGSYDFGAVAPGAGSNVNAQDFVDAGHSAVTNAAAFSADIKNLQSRGLNQADLQSLIAKGPAAIAAANALVHSTYGQLRQINAEHAALAGIAAGLGSAVADAADGSTVKAAQTVVNGLIAHEKLLTAAMVNLAKAIGGKLAGHNASGTENWSGGWTWVGEQGPELMNLPAGSKIRSNAASRRMAQGGAGGSGTVVHVPTELVLRDVDGALIGRMKVEAERVVETGARRVALLGWDS